MPVPIFNVGKQASLRLVFSYKKGKTFLKEAYQEPPYKVTKLYYPTRSELPQMILMSSAPGIFGGDDLNIDLTVEPGAKILITTQSSTKIHPSENRVARQTTQIHVKEDAELHFWSDPLIPFAESRFRQNINIRLHPSSKLSYWDALSAGRILHGERWKFKEFTSETKLFLEESLLFIDRYNLSPEARSPSSRFLMEDNNYQATCLAFSDKINTNFCAELRPIIKNAFPDELIGISTPDSLLFTGRVLSSEGSKFKKVQSLFFKFLSEHRFSQEVYPS